MEGDNSYESENDEIYNPPPGWEDDDSSNDASCHSEQLTLPVSNDDESKNVGKVMYPEYNEDSQFGANHLEVGMEFRNLKVFKAVVKDYTIYHGKQIKWVNNDNERARAKCKEEGCQWEIYCSWSKVTKSFQLKTFEEEHTCGRSFKNNQASRKWVVSKLVEKMKFQPSVNHIEAFDYMKTEFGVHLDDTKIFRSLKEAKTILEGSVKEQYGLIWDYGHELARSDPRSTIKINCIPVLQSPPQSQRSYICLDACKRGFKVGCRPFIGLDGCFLKGYYGGQLLSVVVKDANNGIYVIAYAIVDVEDKENWKLFLTLLHEDLGDG